MAQAKMKQYKAIRQMRLNQISELKALAERSDDEIIRKNFMVRMEDFGQIHSEFLSKHEDIVLLTALQEDADASLPLEDAIRKRFDGDCAIIKTVFANILASIRTTSPPPVTPKPEIRNIKLPDIELPKFSGDFKQFRSFIDRFNSLVHNNAALNAIDKYNYLISSLSGQPLTLIKSTPLTEDNYENAYKSLVNRYDNKRLIAISHLQAIDNAPIITPQNKNAHTLRNLVDIFNENLTALKSFALPVEEWDFLLYYILSKHLDHETKTQYEFSSCCSKDTLPSFYSLSKFISDRCDSLDAIEFSKTQLPVKNKFPPTNYYKDFGKVRQSSTFFTKSNSNLTCYFCKSNHTIYQCQSFRQKPPQERLNFAVKSKLCLNCLSSLHILKNCNSKSTCRFCNSTHHSLLHTENEQSSRNADLNDSVTNSQSKAEPSTSNSIFNGMASAQSQVVLLSTAFVEVLDNRGNYQIIRILLDSGSQANFITEKCVNKLGLTEFPLSLSISGIGEMKNFSCNNGVSCTIKPVEKVSPFFTIDAVVIPKICSKIPSTKLKPTTKSWNHLKGIKFSDPSFHIPGHVDLLIGAELFPHILKSERIVGGPNDPVALNTIFGWVVMGKTTFGNSTNITCHLIQSSSSIKNDHLLNLDKTLKNFWELEEIPTASLSPEDELCERIYINSVERNDSGKYTVSLPFRNSEPEFDFNDTRSIALRRFYSLEKRLSNFPTLSEEYKVFMQDRLDSGHLVETSSHETNKVYYIPHHCVMKPQSTTTKLRVVFDASCKTSAGISLNDTLLVGPKLQKNIFAVLLNFRIHKLAFTADIKQMFLQIHLQENHQDYQRVLWRFSLADPIKDYKLTSVTFGLSCSPYLANRTILKLAEDEAKNFPKASNILQTNIYVDDVVMSCDNLKDALSIQKELIALLNKGGFDLRKWASNSSEFLENIPESHRYSNSLSFDHDDSLKVLGLKWQSNFDFFSYSISVLNEHCTKRSILSEISRIFDPLGFLTPLTLYSKYLMQNLWLLGLEWDEKPPPEICESWIKYKSELYKLSEIFIPRCILHNISNILELHGFCDASEKGYASVIYFREKIENNYKIHLVCAKGKVSPLKKISIPRLELCAASLLADLYSSVHATLKEITFSNIYFWTDSSTVLHWIRSPPHKWKTFVCNRVSKIQEQISPSLWHYVKSSENPADCASRGLLPSQLLNHPLWWAGPPWLQYSKEKWPVSKFDQNSSELSIEQRINVFTSNIESNVFDVLLEKFSSFTKIVDIMAFILRFVHNSRNPKSQRYGMFTFSELKLALLPFVKHVQQTHFENEIVQIRNKKLPSKYLRKLNIFLDKNDILRVGGRLTYSKLSYAQKHPMLLPKNSRLTEVLISYYHNKYLHPGNQTLHYLLIQKFWILSAKQAIRKVTCKCNKCWKLSPKTYQPKMGNLPELRISRIKPFSCVGVDFAGPISTTLGKIRGAKTYKSYICVFVCFATKAIHLELSSELTTEAFLASFRRFLARRGRCSKIYSDNGTNFVGAARQIKDLFKEVAQQENLQWHFNPPGGSHFSGLAEAGVKSVKTHLLRVIGLQTLTFEEMSTVLCQIESLLNSRPLCPLSSDPNDLSVLSPGHFLTLEPLTSLPEPDLCDLPLNHLSRWQLLQRIQQDFWNRWRTEYLHTLQQREKWQEPSGQEAALGKLVVIKNELVPPLKWSLGRIIELHPGRDGITRVATIRTAQGVIKRPVVKLCPLPDGNN